MSLSRSFLLLLLAGSAPLARSQTLLTRADLDALFAKAPQQMTVPESNCCSIRFQVLDRKPEAQGVEDRADRMLFTRRGHATITLGSGQSARKLEVGPGELVNVPRGTTLYVDPGKERVETIEVRILPTEENRPPRFGALRSMGDVLRSADQDALFAKFDTEQSVYVQPHFRVAFVIRKVPSDFESHGCCVDIYLPVHAGSSLVLVEGTIENAKERGPGEIRGTGMTGSHAADIGVGDMIVIRRGGPHYIDPRPGKIGYIIVKVQAE